MIDDSAEHQRLQSENQRLISAGRVVAVLTVLSALLPSTMPSLDICLTALQHYF